MIRLCLLLLALALPARAAEEIVLGLSQDQVAITATFDGSEILIFGAIKRETPIPSESDLEVIIAVSGPKLPATVRFKERRFGIWMNTDAIEVDAAPSFYAVATTAPLTDILTATENLRHAISIPRAIRAVGNRIEGSGTYVAALIRIREEQKLYQMLESSIDLEEDTLFRTSVALPANLIEGNYTVRIFLTRNRQVIDSYETVIGVQKVGVERWLFNLSRQQPVIYGMLSLVIAIAAGWGVSAGFAALRR